MYHAHRIQDVTVEEKDGQLTCSWTFRFSDVEEKDSVLRRGLLSVVSSLDNLKEEIPLILDMFANQLGESPAVEGSRTPERLADCFEEWHPCSMFRRSKRS